MTGLTKKQKDMIINIIEIAIYLGLFIYQCACLIRVVRRVRTRMS